MDPRAPAFSASVAELAVCRRTLRKGLTWPSAPWLVDLRRARCDGGAQGSRARAARALPDAVFERNLCCVLFRPRRKKSGPLPGPPEQLTRGRIIKASTEAASPGVYNRRGKEAKMEIPCCEELKRNKPHGESGGCK